MYSSPTLLRYATIPTTFFLLFLTWHLCSLSLPPTSSIPWISFPEPSNITTSPPPPLHDTSNILLVLKTGASVISSRLPAHINTTLPAAKHLLILSSLSQTFSGYPVHDILVNVSDSWKQHHQDFKVYRQLQELGAENQDAIQELASQSAWDLDKWKFMPMLFESYQQAPEEVEWFVMIEGDTSLSWTNLIWWLSSFDANKPRYMGAANKCVVGPLNGQLFAHGGSGVVWSRSAVEKVLEVREREGVENYDRRWEEITNKNCCGDVVLAAAFEEAGVRLTRAGPMLQGATPDSFVWSLQDWCRPPITWHHVSPDEVEQIHDFSERWAMEQKEGVPYFFSDVYAEFLAGRRRAETPLWDNGARKPWEGNHTSKAECTRACRLDKYCLQWMFAEGELGSSCLFGQFFSVGEALADEEDEEGRIGNWTSGWIEEKVEKAIMNFGPC
ncbi:uncharacterized protein RCC_07883 [Ramularia collo-cygni]|uniref:N-acetylgalactosaminide beta-1,3-galactosyltransferase n=1 Tax=Ramularia collo-cygni TaxID=112498 RepID=A0A2D3VGH9_9PEZI|nr:uncharacterized protein RCC_07883 [Ramularia collo-cygni]CZT22014.1 uncharacterized protein RCC_07883 [Ramularia collo-cygni]